MDWAAGAGNGGWGPDNARALAGLAALIAAAWAMGGFKRPPALLIPGALALQFAIVLVFFAAPPVRDSLFALTATVEALLAATQAGTAFVFGYVGGGPAPFVEAAPEHAFNLAFQVLPLVIVLSGLAAVLWRWRVLPVITRGLALVLRSVMRLPGAASLAVAANIFLGMVEAAVLVRPYLAKLTRSELLVVMTAGLATVAGTVLVIYAVTLGAVLPDAAGHVAAASLMSAPAAVMIARLMLPEREASRADDADALAADETPRYTSTLGALTAGVGDGLKLYLNILAMLIAFVALVALVNGMLGALPDVAGAPLSVERVFGWALMPVMWLIGVPWGAEANAAGGLFGVKTALNEFIAFQQLIGAADSGAVSPRTSLILAYALCGFANFGSLGILIAGLTTMIPDRRDEVVALAPRALVAGSMATLMTGAVVAALPAGLFGV